ncbi:MAG: hypothetical protein ABR497_06335, partial [Kiritimatiellia bacterium]
TYIRKISGATLPIQPPLDDAAAGTSNAPAASDMPVKIYVGQSPDTDRLGITGGDLKWGAYRMRSGPDWLALIGNDTVFIPKGIYSKDHKWKSSDATQWLEAAGTDWGNPIGPGLDKKYSKSLDMWRYDEK